MTFCVACQIGSHFLCRREPECSCECMDNLSRYWARGEFNKQFQNAMIEAEIESEDPRHENCDGAPDGGHSEECRAME